jgi:hypothetical protein
MPRVIVHVAVVALLLLVSGCGGGTGRYAMYQDKKASIHRIDAVIAGLPVYAGAHVRERQDIGRSYHVPSGDFIEAAPYMSTLYVDVAGTVSGAALRSYFRSGLQARGWRCAPSRRTSAPYVVHCVRGQASVTFRLTNGHYELYVAADHVRPPIPTVPGD